MVDFTRRDHDRVLSNYRRLDCLIATKPGPSSDTLFTQPFTGPESACVIMTQWRFGRVF